MRVGLPAARRTHVGDHFASGLVALPVVGPLLLLLQHALPGGAVLQGKFAQDFAEAVNADLARRVDRVSQEQEEGVEPEGAPRDTSERPKGGDAAPAEPYLLMILRWTIFRMMILSAQSFRKSDIFCFSASFISCLAMTLR